MIVDALQANMRCASLQHGVPSGGRESAMICQPCMSGLASLESLSTFASSEGHPARVGALVMLELVEDLRTA